MAFEDVEIVTLAQAKAHAGITDTDRDEDLIAKLEEAHGLVLDYISRTDATWTATMEAWDGDSAPRAVRAAIARQFADLARFRGDDDDDAKANGYDLSPRVTQLLRRYRDPALA